MSSFPSPIIYVGLAFLLAISLLRLSEEVHEFLRPGGRGWHRQQTTRERQRLLVGSGLVLSAMATMLIGFFRLVDDAFFGAGSWLWPSDRAQLEFFGWASFTTLLMFCALKVIGSVPRRPHQSIAKVASAGVPVVVAVAALIALMAGDVERDGPSIMAAPGKAEYGLKPLANFDARAALAGLTERPPTQPLTGQYKDNLKLFTASDRAPATWSVGAGCDLRSAVLMRDGSELEVDGSCDVRNGRWKDPYLGYVMRRSHLVEIDHLVPRAHAWRMGADLWKVTAPDRFEQFSTDPVELVATSARANRKKGDRGPARWIPPLASAKCGYAVRWIYVKHTYGLFLEDEQEREHLEAGLTSCGT